MWTICANTQTDSSAFRSTTGADRAAGPTGCSRATATSTCPAFFGALDAGGFKGWYDLEVFSDDGRWAEAYPDSVYKLKPVDAAKRGVAGFRKAWDERKTPAAQK